MFAKPTREPPVRRDAVISLPGLLVAGVLVVLMALLIERLRGDIVTYQSEAQGTAQIEKLYRVVNSVQGHRDFSIAWLAGTAERREELIIHAIEVRNALAAARPELPASLLDSPHWRSALTDWEEIDADGLDWTMQENYRRHTQLAASILALIIDVADHSRLTLDAHLDTYYLQDMVVNKLPVLQEVLSHHRALGVLAITQPKIRSQVAQFVRPMLDRLAVVHAAQNETFERLDNFAPEMAGDIARVRKDMDARLGTLNATVEAEILGGRSMVTGEAFFDQVTEIVDASHSLAYETFVPELRRRLDARAQAARRMMGFVGLAVLVAIVSLHLLVRQVRRHSRELEAGNDALVAENRLRRQTEEELHVSMAAAVSANRAKSEFLANLSHEVRTPLNGILGMADLLAMSALDDEQAALLKEMAASGKSLKAMLDRIIDFTHIEAGEITLANDPFAVEPMVSLALSRQRAAAAAKGLALAAELAPDLPAIVIGDERRVLQALECLLDNAIKFTETGQVLVTVRATAPAAGTVGLEFAVADTGIGVPEDKRQLIFDSFTQADGSITRRAGGNGLGLAIARRLAQLQGGSVELAGREGGGSVFTLSVRAGAFVDA